MALPVLKGAPSKQADSLSMRLKSVNVDGRDSSESCRPINSHFEGYIY